MKVAVVVMGDLGNQVCAALEKMSHEVVPVKVSPHMATALQQEHPDVCFVAVSDATVAKDVQELLAVLDILSVGSDASALSASMRRGDYGQALVTYQHASQENVAASVPSGVVFSPAGYEALGIDQLLELVEKHLPGGFPLCVKSSCAGAYEGLSKVANVEELKAACAEVVQAGADVMIQEWVEGIDLKVAVLGEGWDAYALPPVRITAEGELEAPVSYGELSPSEHLAQAIRSEIERAAVEMCRVLGIRDMAEVSLVWDGAQARIVAVDPCPNICPGTSFAAACETAGISFDNLVNALAGGLE